MPTFDYSIFESTSIADIPEEKLAEIKARLKKENPRRKYASLQEYADAILALYTAVPARPMADHAPTPKRPRNRRVRKHETLDNVVKRESLAAHPRRAAQLTDHEVHPPHVPEASNFKPRPYESPIHHVAAADLPLWESALRRQYDLPTPQAEVIAALEKVTEPGYAPPELVSDKDPDPLLASKRYAEYLEKLNAKHDKLLADDKARRAAKRAARLKASRNAKRNATRKARQALKRAWENLG